MLVLSRRKNEAIVIDDNITIVVVEIRGDKVRLGIEASEDVPVHRQEVYDAIKKERNIGSGSFGSNTDKPEDLIPKGLRD